MPSRGRCAAKLGKYAAKLGKYAAKLGKGGLHKRRELCTSRIARHQME